MPTELRADEEQVAFLMRMALGMAEGLSGELAAQYLDEAERDVGRMLSRDGMQALREARSRLRGHTRPIRLLGDGRVLGVEPQTFNRGLLTLGPVSDIERYYDECYEYQSYEGAVEAMRTWDPEAEDEPSGWYRHKPSNRRRPNGDKRKEFVAP